MFGFVSHVARFQFRLWVWGCFFCFVLRVAYTLRSSRSADYGA